MLVNYDLPWNPSRLVQRAGRLYRYGQTQRVIVFNLMADDGFDNRAISLMLERVDRIAAALRPVSSEVTFQKFGDADVILSWRAFCRIKA